MDPSYKEEGEMDAKAIPSPVDADVEQGDRGIINKAAPLARQLQGRHMQMIAIGTVPSTHLQMATIT
jgi:amino acid transporter